MGTTTGRRIATSPHILRPSFPPTGARSAFISTKLSIEIHERITDAILATYTGHSNPPISEVKMLAWSPDGTRIASCSYDYIYIWDALTGVHQITVHSPSFIDKDCQLIWSPDSTYLAASGYDGDSLYTILPQQNLLQISLHIVTPKSVGRLIVHVLLLMGEPVSTFGISLSEIILLLILLMEENFLGRSDSTRIVSCSKDITVHVWQAT